MGLFGKLKSSMNGGVKVHIQAPSAVPSNEVIEVTVTVTSESTQTISSVQAVIKAQAREQGISIGNGQGMGVDDSRTMEQTVAQVESRDSFTISPGETKTVTLQLYLNGGAASGSPVGQMGNMGGGALGGLVETMASVAQNFEHINYIYTVYGSVDVQGHSLNPSDKQPIQILPPSGSTQGPQQPQVENLQNQPTDSNPTPSV
jgi:hypothetical protein